MNLKYCLWNIVATPICQTVLLDLILLLAWVGIVQGKTDFKVKDKMPKTRTCLFSQNKKKKRKKVWVSFKRRHLALQTLLWAPECKIWTLSWSCMGMGYIFFTMTFGCSARYRLIGFNSKGQVTPRDNETTDISSLIAWSIKTREADMLHELNVFNPQVFCFSFSFTFHLTYVSLPTKNSMLALGNLIPSGV